MDDGRKREDVVIDSPLVCHRRQLLADTIARLQLPLEVVLSPVPPLNHSLRVWRAEHDAVQAALEDLRRALLAGKRAAPARAVQPRQLPSDLRAASQDITEIDTG
jgi:hypothetical protein